MNIYDALNDLSDNHPGSLNLTPYVSVNFDQGYRNNEIEFVALFFEIIDDEIDEEDNGPWFSARLQGGAPWDSSGTGGSYGGATIEMLINDIKEHYTVDQIESWQFFRPQSYLEEYESQVVLNDMFDDLPDCDEYFYGRQREYIDLCRARLKEELNN